MEAAGIGGFVILAGGLTVFLEHPSMPVMKTWLQYYPLLRRTVLGICLGLYVACTVKLFGKLSGTHVNPAVTCTFFRLRNIGFVDAVCYVLAQFTGALIAFYLLKFFAGDLFSYPLINYGVTKPQPPHTATGAFVAEFIISFILMMALLLISSSRKSEKYVAPATGILLALYIIFELPYSGMSMNPARSFAAAFGAGEWRYLWIYFVSPTAAMLLAAELFIVWKKRCIAMSKTDYKNIGMFPVTKV